MLKGIKHFGRFNVFKSYHARFKYAYVVPPWFLSVLEVIRPGRPSHSVEGQIFFKNKVLARILREYQLSLRSTELKQCSRDVRLSLICGEML